MRHQGPEPARDGRATRDRGARRDLLSRAEPDPSGRVPAEGALGRLGRARLEGVADARRAALHARADDVLQLRIGVRAAGLRRPRHAAGPQVRGQPRASRDRAAATAPRGRRRSTRSTIPTASCIRSSAPGKRGEGKWARVSWDEALDDIAGRIRTAISRRPAERGHVPRRPARARTASPSACSPPGASTATTRTPTSARRGARAGYHFWMGLDRPSPDHANADVILLISAHLESGHYFNPHAQRIIEGKTEGREADRVRHAAVEHRHARRSLARAVARLRSGDPARDRELPDPARAATTASSCGAGGTGRSTWHARAARASTPTFEQLRSGRSKSSTRDYTFEFAARESGVDAPTSRGDRARSSRRRGTRLVDAQLAQRRRRATWAAGRWRARSSCSTRCSAPSPPRAARIRTPGTSSCRSPIYMPPHPTRGTS